MKSDNQIPDTIKHFNLVPEEQTQRKGVGKQVSSGSMDKEVCWMFLDGLTLGHLCGEWGGNGGEIQLV